MLSFVQTKTQEQGLTGYSSVLLTSRAPHRLGKCRLSWVWLGFGLPLALSECSACSGRGSHRHASLASSRYRLTRQLSPDMTSSVHLSFFLHSSCFLVKSFSYTPRVICFIEEFLLHSSSWFYWGVSLALLELMLLRSFSYTPRAGFTERFLLHSGC